MKAFMILPALALVAASYGSTALASDVLEWDGAIGSNPVARLEQGDDEVPKTFRVTRNDVRGVAPGGLAWVIEDFEATFTDLGVFQAEGKGLLLAAGAPIGTVGGVRQVVATLFCGDVEKETFGPADLDRDGDFKIENDAMTLTLADCVAATEERTNVTLLIRNFSPDSGPGSWFAAGILEDQEPEEDED